MIRAAALAVLLAVASQLPAGIAWLPNPRTVEDAQLAPWRRGVGPPAIRQTTSTEPADLASLAVVSWNVHGNSGRLLDFLAQLRAGLLTGRPVRHFALLLQEVLRYRSGPPAGCCQGMERANRLAVTDTALPDIVETAAAMDLSLVYVPSMRNGQTAEDRGNAIVSTLPLEALHAFELPFVAQRRVGVAAGVRVRDGESTRVLGLANVHFDVLARNARSLSTANPRPLQAEATLRYLASIGIEAPAVLGGDLNSWAWGETAPSLLRAGFSSNHGIEDERPTFRTVAGWRRMDFLFFKLDRDLCGDTRVIESFFGSDHRPVVGTFARRPAGCR